MNTACTLLIPCYNAAAFLPRLVESVHALTQPFSTVIFYDDGSSDDTVAVARQLGLEILTGNPNRGVAHARNQLAAAARTEWIHFHDVDDPLAPQFIERLAPSCNSAYDVISCDADWLDDHTRACLIAWRYDPRKLTHNPVAHLLQSAMGLNNSIIRRSSWARVKGCDETLAMWEDADVHIRLAMDGARFHHVPEVLTYSLRRGESFSHDYRKSWACRVSALERYAMTRHPPEITAILAAEAERAAGELALLDERTAAERALALCRRLGARPPTSRHPAARILKLFVPSYALVRWQARRRRQHSQ